MIWSWINSCAIYQRRQLKARNAWQRGRPRHRATARKKTAQIRCIQKQNVGRHTRALGRGRGGNGQQRSGTQRGSKGCGWALSIRQKKPRGLTTELLFILKVSEQGSTSRKSSLSSWPPLGAFQPLLPFLHLTSRSLPSLASSSLAPLNYHLHLNSSSCPFVPSQLF